jgi:hypothetical protein
MGVSLSRNLGAPANLSPAEFCLDAGLVHICCPQCARVTPLDDSKHIVARLGSVTPAWKCPACSFFEWLVLEPST